MDVFAFILLIAIKFSGCHGYGLGVPATACTEMFPYLHYVNASTSASPYEILVNATSYQPGDVIEIQLNSKTDTVQPDGSAWYYAGVMVQVRSRDCQNERAWGKFHVKPDEDFLQPIDCFNTERSSIRHFNFASIYNRTFYWTAPAIPVGHVFVRATVARHMELFWTNVFSQVIADTTDSANTANTQPCAPQMDYRPFCDETSSAMKYSKTTTFILGVVLTIIRIV